MKEFQANPEFNKKKAQEIAMEKRKQILDKNYLSALEKNNPHIKVWHLIGIGCIRTVIEYDHAIRKIADDGK